ncbi:hypothetical protein [Mycolicibacterium iranicum]|uniref:Diacylglycerol O-acyltransferase n=1 Tax=Mycolicibacterium iranicum TaxID=912594 RepID=A0A178LFS6_MYCIR|nr:hypothetical protein [Mycolicibacterium iranicum]OAN28593.1 hypothetical protein A4X20_10360 [Mycolicibacterium iranicum]
MTVLDYVDQAMYLGLRATGQAAAMQCIWVYEHRVDLDAVRRFHRSFGNGLWGRCIERSAVPFGRHRWVRAVRPPADIDIEARPRPRAELADWLDERAVRPVDPEWGPSWHLGALPMTDGATAVCLTLSHCISDGGGAVATILDTIAGEIRDFGYPAPQSRTRRGAFIEDLRQSRRDLPQVTKTLATAGRIARRRLRDRPVRSASKGVNGRGFDDTRHVAVPSVSVFVDLDEWDRRAAALGGNAYSLLAGFCARLADSMGRCAADGKVPLIVPINDRTGIADTRANAVQLASVRIDPAVVCTDLSGTRAEIRHTLATLGEVPEDVEQLLPLIPFVPKVAVRRGAEMAFNFAEQPVSCSNMGNVSCEIARLDGTEAEYVLMRGVDQHVTRRVLEQRHGLLTIVSARVCGRLSLAVVGYAGGVVDTRSALRVRVERTLSDFQLTGAVV